MDFIWESLVLALAGMVLLRIAGRKSISQMTVAQTVIMISIGSIIIEPIIEQSVWKTIISSAIFIGILILMEYLQVKFNWIEKTVTGKSQVVILDGVIMEGNLRKLRFTIDQLEMRLRQKGIKNISDIQTATLEPNGQLGYELTREAQPVTIGDIEKMLSNWTSHPFQGPNQAASLFKEVKEKEHDSKNPPKFH